jgi:hypothetical protein
VPGSGTPLPLAPLPENPLLPKSLRPPDEKPLGVLATLQLLETKFVLAMVTEPVCANALPHTIEALGSSVMLSIARIFPAKVVLEPRVAELPTSQYTESVGSPPSTTMDALLPVVSVLPIRNTNIALDSPSKLRVSAPSTCADDENV